MIELTIFESKGQTKCIAVVKEKSHHLAIFEDDIIQSRLGEIDITDVASDKCAINEFGLRK